jgi:hypothetical protein
MIGLLKYLIEAVGVTSTSATLVAPINRFELAKNEIQVVCVEATVDRRSGGSHSGSRSRSPGPPTLLPLLGLGWRASGRLGWGSRRGRGRVPRLGKYLERALGDPVKRTRAGCWGAVVADASESGGVREGQR